MDGLFKKWVEAARLLNTTPGPCGLCWVEHVSLNSERGLKAPGIVRKFSARAYQKILNIVISILIGNALAAIMNVIKKQCIHYLHNGLDRAPPMGGRIGGCLNLLD